MDRKILPYSPNMMFPGYILGCHQYTISSNVELKITGISIVKNKTLDDVRKSINKKYGIGGKEQ